MATEKDSPPNRPDPGQTAPGRTAIIALTRNGARMAQAIAGSFQREGGRDFTLFLDRRYLVETEDGPPAQPFDLPLRPVVRRTTSRSDSCSGLPAMMPGPTKASSSVGP